MLANLMFVKRKVRELKRSSAEVLLYFSCIYFHYRGSPRFDHSQFDISPIRQQLMSPKACRFDSQTRQFDIQISCATHPVCNATPLQRPTLQVQRFTCTARASKWHYVCIFTGSAVSKADSNGSPAQQERRVTGGVGERGILRGIFPAPVLACFDSHCVLYLTVFHGNTIECTGTGNIPLKKASITDASCRPSLLLLLCR